MEPVTLRRANPEDAAQIHQVHRASITELCGSDYTAEQIEAWIGPRKHEDYVQAIEAVSVYVAEKGSQVVGFGMFDQQNGLVLATYVHPSHVGAGIGSDLLGAMEAEAASAGLSKVWLNATLNSVSFYQAHGFESLGRSTNTLPDGVALPL